MSWSNGANAGLPFVRPSQIDVGSLRREAAAIIRAMFPGHLKQLNNSPVSMFGVSRARQDGGPLAHLAIYLTVIREYGASRAVAEQALAWLNERVEAAYADKTECPIELSVAEQQREGEESSATLSYLIGPSPETAARLIEASLRESSVEAARRVALRRMHGL